MKCDVFWVSGFIVMTFSILSLAPKRNYRKILYQCQHTGVNIVVGFFSLFTALQCSYTIVQLY